MKVIIQTPDFTPERNVEKFVDKHVRKLGGLSSRILESRVLLKTDHSDNVESKVCELQIVIPGNDLFASKRGSTFEEATIKAVAAAKHQLEKIKEKTSQ